MKKIKRRRKQQLTAITPAEDARVNQGPITALAFNGDSTVLLTGSSDNHSKMLHIQNKKVSQPLSFNFLSIFISFSSFVMLYMIYADHCLF